MDDREIFQKIYSTVEKIPFGKVATYGQIAMMIGRPSSARVVGYAISKSPRNRNLPCHRVVNKTGRPAPSHVFDGAFSQRTLLEAEGVTFLSNGCVNMGRHLWSGGHGK